MQLNKRGPRTRGRRGHVAWAFLPPTPGRTCARVRSCRTTQSAGDLAAEDRPAEKKSGGEGAMARERRGHCVSRGPGLGTAARPPRPPRTALPLRSGRREQLSSRRAKLEGTRDDAPAGRPRGGHSPPSRGPKDRRAALCAGTSARKRGGTG